MAGEIGFCPAHRPFQDFDGPRWSAAKPNYFFLSSFFSDFGLHFSQTFLFLAASTQHLCVHSLPLAFASSQQEALTEEAAANMAKVAITVNNLMLFISFLFCRPVYPATGLFNQTVSDPTTRGTDKVLDWLDVTVPKFIRSVH